MKRGMDLLTRTAAVLAGSIAFCTIFGVVAIGQTRRNMNDSKTMTIIRKGDRSATKGSDATFTGSVSVEMLFAGSDPSRVSGGSVTFQPCARSAWHTHPLGQALIVTAGKGWVQQEGGEKIEIVAGDVVWTPPGVKHWHGATAATAITHIAIQEALDGKAVEWLEKVTDEQYYGPKASGNASREPSALKKSLGDFSPKLVELTDDVLFGDVWERPELSKRDRSLVTVSALITGGNTEQLRFHLVRAKENGVTESELIETITHLAFYTGWPRAMSAITLAKEVFTTEK